MSKPIRVLFRTWKALPDRGLVLAVLVDYKIKCANPDLRVAYSHTAQKIEVDMYSVRFETQKATLQVYQHLLTALYDKLGYSSILVIDSLSDLHSEQYNYKGE